MHERANPFLRSGGPCARRSGADAIVGAAALAAELRVILVSAYRDRADLFRSGANEVGAEAFFAKDDLDLEVVLVWQAS